MCNLTFHLYFSLNADISDAGRGKWLSMMRNEFQKSPYASNVIFGSTLVVLEKLVEYEFACPCNPKWNWIFASAFFIAPGFIASVLMAFTLEFRADRYLIFSIFTPAIFWVILLFIDGQYFACAKTYWSGRFVTIDKAQPQKWCEPTNHTSSYELIIITQGWFSLSQVSNNMISLKIILKLILQNLTYITVMMTSLIPLVIVLVPWSVV